MNGAYVGSFVVGITLGVLFYGGLWITVRQLAVTRHPVSVTLVSLLVRMVMVLTGFLLVARGQMAKRARLPAWIGGGKTCDIEVLGEVRCT